ncbi:hypothetical protein ONZ45_g12129 [Pleurotus djamor]|nr:hypothetical protein ONZ45_g12129 [Pleurotus djamor]
MSIFTRALKSFALVATTILFYDHLLTFGDEIQHIWKKPKTPLSLLFLLNRYFAPPVFIICIIALFSPDWTVETLVGFVYPLIIFSMDHFRCTSFAKFEGVLTLVTVMVAESMLILRVYAVYHQSRLVLVACLTVWITQLGLMSYILAHSGPVVIPRTPVTYGCILVADLGSLNILFVVPSIVFDTTIFVMLMVALVKKARDHPLSMMLQIILRDGILYFVVVFMLNSAWTGTGLGLSMDLKNILSFPCTAMTNVLIGRLTLNLRKNSNSLVFDTSSSGRLRRFVQFGDASSSGTLVTDVELRPTNAPSKNNWGRHAQA